MAGFLFDENLPAQIAEGLSTCGLTTYAVGDSSAPSRGSSDAENVAWCLANQCALVTTDRGRKNPEIKLLLASTKLSLVLVSSKLTTRALLYKFVKHHLTMEAAIDKCLASGGTYRVRIKREGGLERL